MPVQTACATATVIDPEAKYNPCRRFDIAVRACQEPGLPVADHDAVVMGEIAGRFRNSTTLHIVLRGGNDERHRPQRTSDQPGRRLVNVARIARS